MKINQTDRIQHIQRLFESHPDVFDLTKPEVLEISSKGSKRVTAVLPLLHHTVYGETVLFINEKIENEDLKEYRYGWELSQRQRKMGVSSRFLTAFDKQSKPNPPYNNINTDPYHHHFEIGNKVPRTETSVQSLEDVIAILRDYIKSGEPYCSHHRFI
ncbi:toxin-antitoxin system TumE family protein [Rossellomorea vietnamensis]|uniref:toxin-antitoxin system TumE family protein n=1 Tax=Rossellomorea vietnamensis TaxID=218284 RepID=UPI003D29A115